MAQGRALLLHSPVPANCFGSRIIATAAHHDAFDSLRTECGLECRGSGFHPADTHSCWQRTLPTPKEA